MHEPLDRLDRQAPQHRSTLIQSVPVVDMAAAIRSNGTDPNFVSAFTGALREIGFCVVTNHGVNQDLIDATYRLTRQLFAHDENTLKKYERAEIARQRGYTSFRVERAKDKDSSEADLKAFFHVGSESDTNDPRTADLLPNIWPDEVPGFREVARKLFGQLNQCAGRLLRACAIDLSQDPDQFAAMLHGGDSILRLLHYPMLQPGVVPKALRAAPHEDINLITLLCEATEPGLEVKTRDGRWLPLTTGPGEIVVNVGDMLQSLTNGLYVSTTHRVINPPGTANVPRFSAPFFAHAHPNTQIGPMAACVQATGGTPHLPNKTSREFLMERLREIGLS
jgi:isopenicillin N synthase-like dioxygenase